MWQTITSVPFGEVLEPAAIDYDGPHSVVFPSRRVAISTARFRRTLASESVKTGPGPSPSGRVFGFHRTCEIRMSNEQIARQIVAKLLAFRTAAPFGKTWEAFATAEILLELNAVSRSQRDHKRPVARREPYEIKG
jgi:hypothetical protein